MGKLKILEVNKFYAPHIGGIETLVEQRARQFAAYPNTEVRVLVCQEKGEGDVSVIDGVEVTRCGSIGTYFSCPVSFSFFRRFKELAEWADVVEIHTPFPLGDAACILSKCKCRVVIAWHSDVIKQKRLLRLYKPLLHKFLQRADAIITATPGHIKSSSFLPEFADKCRIVPYPLEIPRYERARRTPVLTQHLHDKKSVKLLFTGRLVYYKGVSYLIEAMQKVDGCELFICGTGPLEEELREKARDLPVHFLGRLSDEDLKSAFADCDIFVLPSVANSEGFGIVQQEAMVYGHPVINTALPTGVPYVSVDGETGLTVPPKDVTALSQAIQTLVNSPRLREEYGRNAAARVRAEYDLDTNMHRIYDILAEGC